MNDKVCFLEWDSNFFGKRVGRLILKTDRILTDELNEARKEGYSLVYVYSRNEINLDGSSEFLLHDVGGQVTFAKKLNVSSFDRDKSPCIFRYTEKKIKADILELALLSGHLSRFRVDPCLPRECFKNLYLAWVTSALGHGSLDTIHIYKKQEDVVGLVTASWDKDACIIGLLAVNSYYQGLGIGSQLLKHLECLCAEQNVLRLEVKTQLVNARAQSFYRKNSFNETCRTFLYHAHLDSSLVTSSCAL